MKQHLGTWVKVRHNEGLLSQGNQSAFFALGSKIFGVVLFCRRSGVMSGADSDRFHRFPCIGQVSKPKKE